MIKTVFKVILAIAALAVAAGIFGFTMGLVYGAIKVSAKFGAGLLL